LIGGDLKRKCGPFGTEKFLAPRKTLSHLCPPPADIATENFRNRVRLIVAGSIVDNYASTASRIVVPKVSIKTPHLDDTEIIEFDISKMTVPDMPEKHVLAKIVVWGLTKCARASDSTTAVVEPITSDAPIRGIGYIIHCYSSISQGKIKSVSTLRLNAIEQMH
jgi:hypothetical protein